MPTSPSPIDPLSTPPSTTDQANFDTRGDEFLGDLPTMATQMNAAATVTYNNAVEAAASATTANAARDAAIAVADAAMWSAATNYPTGTAAISPTNYRTYIRKSPGGVNATDPSAAPTLWEIQNPTRVTAGVIEHWNGTEYVPHGWKELATFATTSGTSFTFSSLPAWVRELQLVFSGVSQSSTGFSRLRLGTAGGIVTTGYLTHAQYSFNTSTTTGAVGTDAAYIYGNGPTVVTTGSMSMVRYGTLWVLDGQFADTGVPGHSRTTGRIDLGAALTQIEVAATSGAYDAGAIYLLGRA